MVHSGFCNPKNCTERAEAELSENKWGACSEWIHTISKVAVQSLCNNFPLYLLKPSPESTFSLLPTHLYNITHLEANCWMWWFFQKNGMTTRMPPSISKVAVGISLLLSVESFLDNKDFFLLLPTLKNSLFHCDLGEGCALISCFFLCLPFLQMPQSDD